MRSIIILLSIIVLASCEKPGLNEDIALDMEVKGWASAGRGINDIKIKSNVTSKSNLQSSAKGTDSIATPYQYELVGEFNGQDLFINLLEVDENGPVYEGQFVDVVVSKDDKGNTIEGEEISGSVIMNFDIFDTNNWGEPSETIYLNVDYNFVDEAGNDIHEHVRYEILDGIGHVSIIDTESGVEILTGHTVNFSFLF